MSLLLTAVILIGCQESVEDICLSEDSSFVAIVEGFDDSTKTSMDAMNNIVWSEEDRLAIFQGCSMADKYQVKDESVGTGNGTFMLVSDNSSEVNDDFNSGVEIMTNIAIYPYSDNLSVTNATVSVNDGNSRASAYEITGIELPSVQQYVPESFGSNTFPMVAVTESLSDHSLKFKNVLGAIKLQLKGTKKIKSIKIEGKNGEKLSGPATIIAYPDTFAPAIIMSEEASTSVLLDCGEGVQLSESVATSFIISLPSVFFSKGVKLTVTDMDNTEILLESKIANTILRSSILVMPTVILMGSSSKEDNNSSDVTEGIQVEKLSLSTTSLQLYEKGSARINATIMPVDATNRVLTWFSDAPSVATVTQDGFVTAIKEGSANIFVLVDRLVATCSITVKALAVAITDYEDEYGVNWGQGIVIGGAVWAPINCGYKNPTFDDNDNIIDKGYPYGKLYQWGRKHGQGYSGPLYNKNGIIIGEVSDTSVPMISPGGVSLQGGQSDNNKNIFFTGSRDTNYDWLYSQNSTLWNAGTESAPVRNDSYDPCPDGWRVPTYAELSELMQNHSLWTTNSNGQNGCWFSGPNSYSEDVSQIFLPAAGFRDIDGNANGRGYYDGHYWSSLVKSNGYVGSLGFGEYAYMTSGFSRASAYSIRCVQE